MEDAGFGPTIEPAAGFLPPVHPQLTERRAVRPELVRDDGFRLALALHRFPQEPQRRLAIPRLQDIGLERLALVINRSSEIMRLAADLHEHLVQMPSPLRERPHLRGPLPSDLAGEHRAKAVPPAAHHLMADLDAALVEKILHIPQRKRNRT